MAVGILLAGIFQVGIQRFSEFVGVDELVTGVVRRIDKNHLHLAEVGFLQELQHFEIVAFDEQVFRFIEIHGFVTGWF